MIEADDEDTLLELHMRCNHRSPHDIKKMAKDGVLDLQWNENLENELKDFHCESCSAVRLKNQTKGQRRESPRASRPLQIIRMDTIPCPMSVDEEDGFQKLLLKLPKRSVPSPPDYKHMLLLVDEFSRMKWVMPLYSKSSEDIARALEKWITEDLPLISGRIVRNDPSFDRSVENLVVELNWTTGKSSARRGIFNPLKITHS